MDMFAQYALYNIRMVESYPVSFTAGNAERLYLVGARQVKPVGGEFMRFVGTGLNHVIVGGGFIGDEIIMPVELTIIVHEDGSMDSTFVIGEEEPVTESWPADSEAFRLVEFHGAYFLDKEYFSLVRQE